MNARWSLCSPTGDCAGPGVGCRVNDGDDKGNGIFKLRATGIRLVGVVNDKCQEAAREMVWG